MSKVLEYILGTDAAIVLDYGLSSQAVVQGLTKLAPPGFSRQIVTIDELRNEFARKFAGGGDYNDLSFAGNLVVGDTAGQNRLKQYAYDKTKLVGRQLLGFLDYNHFFTTDLANDPSSSMQVVEMSSGEAGKNDAFPITGKIVPNGRMAIYTAHIIEGAVPTLAFVAGTLGGDDTITDTANGFITAGFVVGMTLLIFDSPTNDPIATTVKTVDAGTLTLNSIDLLNSEAGVEGMELHGGSL
ncbi:MAG: hypothetical protein WBB19_17230 [Desulforhopalus sp.]